MYTLETTSSNVLVYDMYFMWALLFVPWSCSRHWPYCGILGYGPWHVLFRGCLTLDPLNLPPKHPKTVDFCGLFVHRCQGLSKGGTGKGISNLNNYIQARWQRFECVLSQLGPIRIPHDTTTIRTCLKRIESYAKLYGPVWDITCIITTCYIIIFAKSD